MLYALRLSLNQIFSHLQMPRGHDPSEKFKTIKPLRPTSGKSQKAYNFLDISIHIG